MLAWLSSRCPGGGSERRPTHLQQHSWPSAPCPTSRKRSTSHPMPPTSLAFALRPRLAALPRAVFLPPFLPPSSSASKSEAWSSSEASSSSSDSSGCTERRTSHRAGQRWVPCQPWPTKAKRSGRPTLCYCASTATVQLCIRSAPVRQSAFMRQHQNLPCAHAPRSQAPPQTPPPSWPSAAVENTDRRPGQGTADSRSLVWRAVGGHKQVEQQRPSCPNGAWRPKHRAYGRNNPNAN